MTGGWRRWRRIFRRAERDVDVELAFHVEERVAELIVAGQSAAAARTQAERELGDLGVVRRELIDIDRRVARRSRRRTTWEAVTQDLGYVLRAMRHSPGFFTAVALTFALGIGANAAVFSVLDRLFLTVPPGVQHADQLRRIVLENRNPSARDHEPRSVLTYDEFHDLPAAIPADVTIGGYDVDKGASGRGDARQPITEVHVIGDYFRVLGVSPIAGRFFLPDELGINSPAQVTVLSDRIWQRDFGGRGDAIGKTIVVDGLPFTVIGVVRGDFHGADNNAADLWMPISAERWRRGASPDWYRGTASIQTLVRVRDTATAAAVAVRATDMVHHIADWPGDSVMTAALFPFVVASLPGEVDPGVGITVRLAIVSFLILLIAGANVTNLILARAVRRRREIAVRLALGVGRRRLVTLLMVESVAAALLGGGAGLLVAAVVGRVLRATLLPWVHWTGGAIDWRVTGFTLAIAVIAGLAAGVVPAVQASRAEITRSLKGSVRDGATRSRLQASLVVVQTALSVVLLIGAGLLIRSMVAMTKVPTGYDADRIIFASVTADVEHRKEQASINARLPALADQLAHVPGVERTALAADIPMWTISWIDLWMPGRDSVPRIGGEGPTVSFVSPAYFPTMGIRLLRGRIYRDNDRFTGSAPVVVDETMARTFWPGADAIGQCLILDDRKNGCSPVIGVVSDVHGKSIVETQPAMHYFVPPADTGFGTLHVIAIRTAPGRVPLVMAATRRLLGAAFAGWSEPDVRAMSDVLAPELRPWRVGAALFSAAAALALLVAVVGIYSTIAYTLSQRTHEIGVRMALGAHAAGVMRLVVGEGVRIVMIGVVVGILLALAGGKVIASLLYATSPRDPMVLVGVSLVLLLVAALACTIPAWRASRVDPVIALRAE